MASSGADMVSTPAPVSYSPQPQVSSAATGSPKVAQSAKQASSLVTLLRATVVRERTSQEIVGVHF